jgi:hypothetical protein
MGARRVDRETAESVAVIAGSGSFPEQVEYGMPITRIRYGSVRVMLGRLSHRVPQALL